MLPHACRHAAPSAADAATLPENQAPAAVACRYVVFAEILTMESIGEPVATAQRLLSGSVPEARRRPPVVELLLMRQPAPNLPRPCPPNRRTV